MARYMCSYIVPSPLEDLESVLKQLLQSCDFEVIYNISDYMMGREKLGQVAFSKLVTAEILIDSSTATKDGVQVSLVVKNDELPLQADNHCHQLFARMQEAIARDYQWQKMESVPS